MEQNNLSLDLLLQETLVLSEYLRANTPSKSVKPNVQMSFLPEDFDNNHQLVIEESIVQIKTAEIPILPDHEEYTNHPVYLSLYPETPGVIYKIHNGVSTFCVRGYTTHNIKEAFVELLDPESLKKPILKLTEGEDSSTILFFETNTFELAEALKEQIINRRFPHQEDAVCNISDPGFSWWMDINSHCEDGLKQGRFEIFFKSHGINRADKYIQLGPIGDGSIAALRMNQAKTLLRSSFPISEFSCDDKSITVASQKPDHLSFISFKNIFLEGINNTTMENFPDNSMGRTLFYYFHELAIVRKFWIEVKTKLG